MAGLRAAERQPEATNKVEEVEEEERKIRENIKKTQCELDMIHQVPSGKWVIKGSRSSLAVIPLIRSLSKVAAKKIGSPAETDGGKRK